MKHCEGKAPNQIMEDGDLLEVYNHIYLSCCDCGLRHHVIVDPQKDGVVKMWWYRDLFGSWINRTTKKFPFVRRK